MTHRPSDDELASTGLTLDDGDSIVTITLDSPANRNAQRPSMWRAFTRIGEWVAHRNPAAVIVQATGPSFSAGLDRAMFTPEGLPGEPSLVALATMGRAELEEFITTAQAGFRWWREVDAVTIAAVRGHAMGAGFQLALACDICIPHPDAVFAMRETSWGLVPDLGGTFPMVVGAGYGPALAACATGASIPAATLASWGLALPAEDDPESAARSLAEALSATPPGAVSALKHLLGEVDSQARAAQWEREREAQIERITALAAAVS